MQLPGGTDSEQILGAVENKAIAMQSQQNILVPAGSVLVSSFIIGFYNLSASVTNSSFIRCGVGALPQSIKQKPQGGAMRWNFMAHPSNVTIFGSNFTDCR